MKLYESIKVAILLFQDEDVVTLSNGNGAGDFGTDLGDGQVGGNDIFN